MLVPFQSSFGNNLVPADSLDRLFEDLLRPLGEAGVPVRRGFPAVDTSEDAKAYYVEAEVPGLGAKDLEISVLGDQLKIEGGRGETTEEKDGKKYHRRERHVGKFRRVFQFPDEIDSAKVEAKFHDGLVTITLPKAEAALPRKIELK